MLSFVLVAMLALPLGEQPTPLGSKSDRLIRVYQQGVYSRDLVLNLQRAVTRLLDGSGIALAFIDCEGQPMCNEGFAGTNWCSGSSPATIRQIQARVEWPIAGRLAGRVF